MVKMVNPSQGSRSLVWQVLSLILITVLGILTLKTLWVIWLRNLFMWLAEQEAGKQVATLSFQNSAAAPLTPSILLTVVSRKQYFPRMESFVILRHSSKFPRSFWLPVRMPDGIRPHESITDRRRFIGFCYILSVSQYFISHSLFSAQNSPDARLNVSWAMCLRHSRSCWLGSLGSRTSRSLRVTLWKYSENSVPSGLSFLRLWYPGRTSPSCGCAALMSTIPPRKIHTTNLNIS